MNTMDSLHGQSRDIQSHAPQEATREEGRDISPEEQFLFDLGAGKISTPADTLRKTVHAFEDDTLRHSASYSDVNPLERRAVVMQSRILELGNRMRELCANIKERLNEEARFQIYDRSHELIQRLRSELSNIFASPSEETLSALEKNVVEAEQWTADQEEMIGNKRWGSALDVGVRPPWPPAADVEMATSELRKLEDRLQKALAELTAIDKRVDFFREKKGVSSGDVFEIDYLLSRAANRGQGISQGIDRAHNMVRWDRIEGIEGLIANLFDEQSDLEELANQIGKKLEVLDSTQ